MEYNTYDIKGKWSVLPFFGEKADSFMWLIDETEGLATL